MTRAKPSSPGDRWLRFFFSLVLIGGSALVLVPMFNLLAVSISEPKRLSEVRGLSVWPAGFSLVNFQVLLENPYFLRSILNSVVITVAGTSINLVATSLAAYALTRPTLPWKRFFMLLVIVIMLLEPALVSEYIVVKRVGLMNSLWAVIIYKAVNVYYLILLMRFFEEVPVSLVEAARIEGADHVTVLGRVILPLTKSALATLGMFYGVFRWNEYFRATIYLNEPTKYPLQVILRQFVILEDRASLIGSGALYANNPAAQLSFEALQAATIIVAMVPVLMLYPLILRYYARGVMEGGVKE